MTLLRIFVSFVFLLFNSVV